MEKGLGHSVTPQGSSNFFNKTDFEQYLFKQSSLPKCNRRNSLVVGLRTCKANKRVYCAADNKNVLLSTNAHLKTELCMFVLGLNKIASLLWIIRCISKASGGECKQKFKVKFRSSQILYQKTSKENYKLSKKKKQSNLSILSTFEEKLENDVL